MPEERAKPPAILFVCLGNICRSPMAEGAMRAAAQSARLALEVDSAGTGAWHAGNPPDTRAQATASRYGVDISGLRARQVVAADFARFDFIFALDRDNLTNLEALAPRGSQGRVRLLMDCVSGREGQSVADPYYGAADGFEATWRDVSAAAEAIAARLVSKL